ncbi:hypothetical protein IGJ66_002050 [Enterococcus sp. DIV0176]|uniref:hypothetical protein n=1 Tax=Enterococcus sp. DIV0176 TaxID=2774758 RepID=UPI003D2FAD98
MSSYYRIIKKEILNKKQYFGIDMQIFYYAICLTGVGTSWTFVSSITRQPVLNDKDNIEALIYLGITVVCYITLKFLNRQIISSNWNSAYKLHNSELVNDATLKYLIQEVEQSVKNIKRFTEWCVGVIVTLVVLVSTLLLNIYSKISDVILKGTDDKDIKEFSKIIIKQLNEKNHDILSGIMMLFFQILFLFSSFILFGYFVFSLFSLVKRQVLVTLYDMRYARALYESNESE